MKTSVARKKESGGPHRGNEASVARKKESGGPHRGNEDLCDQEKGVRMFSSRL